MSQLATRGGRSTSAPADSSRTVTVLDSQTREEEVGTASAEEVGTLRLRGARSRDRPRVVWSEDVVDNEGAGKKSSKICCVYHRPKRFDESSSSDESSGSDSDSSCDRAPHSHEPRKRHRHPKPDTNANPDGGNTQSREGGESVVHELHSDSDEPNMYEKIPKRPKGKGKGKGTGKGTGKGKGVARNGSS
ncbi:unnamed protein product [Somion occarium]|uniref:Type 1 phosphatases regulator n=1 Tax=Somion occarium TaxID=3059160 RepID=A0ABP1EB53_9APHY